MMTTHPRVEFDFSNLSEIELWHQNHKINQTFLLGFHALSSHIAAPTTIFAEAAEDEIREHLAARKPTMLAMTHHHWTDPINAAAAVHKEPALRDIEGRTIIPAKLGLINFPLVGAFITQAGATPAYREKDFSKHFRRKGLNGEDIQSTLDSTAATRKEANRRLRQIESNKVSNGSIYASFVESERNKGDQTKLQPIKKGFQKVAEGLDKPEDCKVICIAFDYSDVALPRFFSPTLYVDVMDAYPTDDLTGRLQDRLKNCLENAVKICHESQTPNITKAGLIAAAVGASALIRRRSQQ